MAELTKQPILITSVEATAELATTNLFVGLTGSYAGAGAYALGVLEAVTSLGQQAPVITLGIALVTAGGAITAGAEVESAAGGKAVAKTTGIALGRALTAAGADGDTIKVKLY